MELMKPEIKARWMEKLRSGEIPQITKRLRDNGGCCGVGVLCEVAVEDGVIEHNSSSLGYRVQRDGYSFNIGLPVAVAQWAGLDEEALAFVYSNVVEMNDDGEPFAGIAQWIEENL